MKGFVIRINNHELSEKLAADALQSCKQFNIDAQYFDAIIPSTLNVFFEQYGVRMSPQFLEKKATHFTTQACFASHYCLWKKCLDINEKILILEHDGVVINSLDGIIEHIKDVCHLDPNRPYSKNYNEKLKQPQSKGVVDFGDSNKWTNDREFTGQHFAGSYAYIISPIGALKILNFISKYGAWEADRLIGKKVLSLQITTGSYARLNKFFGSRNDIQKYSTRI